MSGFSAEMIVTLLAAALGGGALSALVSGVFNRRKARAEAEATVAISFKSLSDAQQCRLEQQQSRIEQLEYHLQEERKRHDALEAQMHSLQQQLGERGVLVAELREDNTRLSAENQALRAKMVVMQAEMESLRKDVAEMPELRRQIEALQEQLAEMQRSRKSPARRTELVPKGE